MPTANLILGDCIDKMKELPSNSVDAIITDPPYGLEFMGKDWDGFNTNQQFYEFNRKWSLEALRVLKPGGFMFAMGGTRTHHRLTCGIEDAGFLIRDELCWVYMQGFPKAQDLGMLIEKRLGGEGEDTGIELPTASRQNSTTLYELGMLKKTGNYKIPTLPQAKEWSGWKTPALKPAFEPIVVAQKPCEGSITENVMKYGVGGYNVDECRIPYVDEEDAETVDFNRRGTAERSTKKEGENLGCINGGWKAQKEVGDLPSGRFPSNLLMQEECFGKLSKFFLIPKSSKGEKNEGCDKLPLQQTGHGNLQNSNGFERFDTNNNNHPTVKPVALMQHLIKLTTKPGYTVLEPFLGSGTTAVACLKLNRNVIGIELNEEYMKIARARIEDELKQSRLEF